jgi:hypothetical protein
VVLAAAIPAACRQAAPIVDNAPKPASAPGTISGTVQGPAATSGIPARTVTVINEATGERRSILTSSTGGFTLEVPPGKYRVEVQLLPGERVIKAPGDVEVSRGDIDAHADFVVGLTGVERPRGPAYRVDNGLGSPIA